jgi:hypothetical protein
MRNICGNQSAAPLGLVRLVFQIPGVARRVAALHPRLVPQGRLRRLWSLYIFQAAGAAVKGRLRRLI